MDLVDLAVEVLEEQGLWLMELQQLTLQAVAVEVPVLTVQEATVVPVS
jgi:hypothetical protein